MIDPRQYISQNIKSDLVIEILRGFDLDIRYDIDLLHENTPDKYWIEAFNYGFCFKANQDKIIDCAFIHLIKNEKYDKFPWDLAELEIVNGEIPSLGSPTKSGVYQDVCWVRYDSAFRSIHVTTNNDGPYLLTIMDANIVP